MARIDLLTAQMCRRAASRMTVQSDEKMQFFGANGEPLGEGALLSAPMIHEFLLPIASVPFDGVPVSLPYRGCDGEFKISVAAHCRVFEIHALSFATQPTPRIQATPPTQPPKEGAKASFNSEWKGLGNNSIAPLNGFRPGPYGLRQGTPEEPPVDAAD